MTTGMTDNTQSYIRACFSAYIWYSIAICLADTPRDGAIFIAQVNVSL